MGRYKEAPSGFQCPYKDHCPHLGMSAKWAALEISDARNQRSTQGWRRFENEEYVRALEEENKAKDSQIDELKARLKHQHQQKFKANKKPKKRPSGKPPRKPRKRGPPAGHPAWTRKIPDRVDQTVHVDAPDICPHCQHTGLEATGNTHTQIQEDIVLQPRTVNTQYIHQTAHCPRCRRDVFKTADGELRNCSIGPITKAAAVYLRHELKLSFRDIEKVFSGLFGMPFVPASAMAFSDQFAKAGASLYEDLRTKIYASQIIHADETSWRIDGQGAQLWYAGNTAFDFFHMDYSRSSAVAVSIFGSSFGGHLVADSYAAYNAIHPAGRQACLAHIKRKADEVAERIKMLPPKKRDRDSLRFCRSLSRFFSHCCRIGRRRNTGELAFERAKKLIPRLIRMRDEICNRSLKDADAENLRKRVSNPTRDGERLFVFLEINGMEPTNNHAEQALRLPVIFRKTSFGSRSLSGAQNLATNLSLIGTAKRQGKDPMDLIKNLLIDRKNASPETLYETENFRTFDTS